MSDNEKEEDDAHSDTHTHNGGAVDPLLARGGGGWRRQSAAFVAFVAFVAFFVFVAFDTSIACNKCYIAFVAYGKCNIV